MNSNRAARMAADFRMGDRGTFTGITCKSHDRVVTAADLGRSALLDIAVVTAASRRDGVMGSPSTDKDPPVLVAHSYFLAYDAKQWERMEPYPPLGTLLAAAAVQLAGHDVRLFDAMLAPGTDEFETMMDAVRPQTVAIVEDNFNYLTKMCTTRMRDAAFTMIAAAKRRRCHVVVNGSDATDRSADYLRAGADAVIIGEPETTLNDLVTAWAHDPDADLRMIPGLALGGDQGGPSIPFRTPPRAPAENLDRLPRPAWHLIDIDRYRRAWHDRQRRFSWNLVASRGCPYRCNWCAKPVFGSTYAQRSPASMADELQYVRDTIRPEHVWFADDIFGLTEPWIEAFAGEVVARGARTPFMMQSRANLMTARVVRALRAAGAEEVWLGAESGSQKILDAMDKGTKVDQVRSATSHLRGEGIRIGWFIQLGYPGETWEDIVATRDLIRDERPDDIGVSVSYPLPGTKFFETVKRQLGLKRNWSDSGELAMMFRGTYTTEFYREIRNLLHDEVGESSRQDLDQQWNRVASRRRASRSLGATHAAS